MACDRRAAASIPRVEEPEDQSDERGAQEEGGCEIGHRPAEIGQNDASPVFGGGVAINARGDIAFTAALHPPGQDQVEWGTGVYVAYAADPDPIFIDGFE